MSTRISRAAALLLLLAGCATSLPAPDRAELRVEGERIAILAPPGYCVDPGSLDVGRGGGMLLMADCAALGAALPDAPPAPGVITVSVSTGGMPADLAELERVLAGPGAALLGRSGQADAVRVIGRSVDDGALYLKVEDRGPQPIPGLAPQFWRVFFPTGPRMAVASVSGFDDAALGDAESRRILGALVARTRAANPPAEVAEAAPAG